MNTPSSFPPSVDRREFLRSGGGAGLAAAATAAFPNILTGQNAGQEKLRVAFVGTGGIGGSHIDAVSRSEDICPCYCDVDTAQWEGAARRWPQAKAYQDYREMFEKEKDNFDAVMIGIPDHQHYPATVLAMQAGKHVYTQKPLTHTVWEARQLKLAAEKYDVATQMGNQGHANEGNRLMYEWVNSGAIGEVREVHCFTNRPVWPQPLDRPEGEDPVPQSLNWDVWLGPAPVRPFKKDVYHSFKWRGWWDFGTGALGDMACHTMDCVIWALDPPSPSFVEVVSMTPMPEESFPAASMVHWKFEAKGKHPAFDLYWHDGGLHPQRPPYLELGRNLPETGALFLGTKAAILSSGDYGDSPRLIPQEKSREIGRPPRMLERSPGHYEEWRMACLGEKPKDFPGSNFAYAANLTETILLGNLALKLGRKLEYDSANVKITNVPEANAFVNKEYRQGWDFKI
ncbi:MAG TPA: Gfo/Idh/MocA family oxidoreductase [Verrucomicrobiales bacterium]|nr:Gfo/Idh/MocA family oxidoreductase [Verrucomicrobiales bacterium]